MKRQLALGYVMNQLWAIDPAYLTAMGAIAERNTLTEAALAELLSADGVSAVEAKSGRAAGPLMQVRENGVAVISVSGVVSRYANWMQAICGGVSTELLAKTFNQALDDRAVRGIVLNIDSPGGDANGIHELAEMIYQARGRKPITAYVGGTGASAAYWIASAADEVVLDATGRLGSIGVVMTLRRSTDDERAQTLEIVSSQSPNKRLDPESQKGREAYQAQMDQLADVFIDRVARNMGVSRETVLQDFAQGGILIGQTAVDKGMAARLGSLEGVIAELGKGKSMSKETKTGANEGEGVTLALTGANALSAADLIAAINEHSPELMAALSAHFNPPPTMALEAAAEIAKACADSGVPGLSASLLAEGVTKAEAEAKIAAAGQLKDTLAAAGLSGSFETLLAHLDDPVKLAGQAIHEAKAATDEDGDNSRTVPIGDNKQETKLDTAAIYQKRRG